MATPPTFVQENETAWNTVTTPKTTGSFTAQVADVLAALVGAEEASGNTFTVSSSPSLTWALQQANTTGSNGYTGGSTASVASAGSMTASIARSGSGTGAQAFGANFLQFRDSDGVGASAKTTNVTGAPSLNVTTLQDNSALAVIVVDWNATDGTSRTWRTVNGSTPTEVTYFRDSTRYTVYGAYWADAGTAGSKTVGLTAPSGQKYSIVVVEIKGTAGGGGGTIVKQLSTLGVG